jgi:hypothetical protein
MLLAWLVPQFAALAYGRGSVTVHVAIAPRYIDIVSVGVLLNFTIILYFLREASARVAQFAYALAACWIAAVCIAGATFASTYVPNEVSDLRQHTQNIKLDPETNNISLLEGKLQDSPHPEAARLIQLISSGPKILTTRSDRQQQRAICAAPHISTWGFLICRRENQGLGASKRAYDHRYRIRIAHAGADALRLERAVAYLWKDREDKLRLDCPGTTRNRIDFNLSETYRNTPFHHRSTRQSSRSPGNPGL